MPAFLNRHNTSTACARMTMTSWLNRCSNLAFRAIHQARSNVVAMTSMTTMSSCSVEPLSCQRPFRRGAQEARDAAEGSDQLRGEGLVVHGGEVLAGGIRQGQEDFYQVHLDHRVWVRSQAGLPCGSRTCATGPMRTSAAIKSCRSRRPTQQDLQ